MYPSVTSTHPSKGSSGSNKTIQPTSELFDSKLQLFNQHQHHSTPTLFDSTCDAMKNVTEQINSFYMPFINASLCELNDCNEIDCTTDEVETIWKIILQCSPQIGIEMLLINTSRGDQESQFFNESGTFFDTFNVTVDIMDSKTMGFGIDAGVPIVNSILIPDVPVVNYILIPLDSCGMPSTHSYTIGPSQSSTIQPTPTTAPATIQPTPASTPVPAPPSVPIPFDSTCDTMKDVIKQINSFFEHSITEQINSFFEHSIHVSPCMLNDCNEIHCSTNDDTLWKIILQCSPQIGIEMLLINISGGDQESQFFTESGTFIDTYNVTVDIMDSKTLGFGIDTTYGPVVNYILIPLDSCTGSLKYTYIHI